MRILGLGFFHELVAQRPSFHPIKFFQIWLQFPREIGGLRVSIYIRRVLRHGKLTLSVYQITECDHFPAFETRKVFTSF